MRGYRERDVHAHTWHRSNDVTLPIPFVLSLSKDGPGDAWFDRPALSQVEGLTASGNDEAEHDDRV